MRRNELLFCWMWTQRTFYHEGPHPENLNKSATIQNRPVVGQGGGLPLSHCQGRLLSCSQADAFMLMAGLSVVTSK